MDHGHLERAERRTPPATAGSRTGRGADQHWVLRLQTTAGNAAVTRMIGGPVVIQRFVGTEHKQLGDSTNRMIDLGSGVVLSFGDLVALSGDEYATLDELLADTRTADGKARLLAAMRDDHIPDPASTKLPEPSADQKSARFLKFLELAAENVSHFNNAGQAVDAWGTGHGTALEEAVQAGLANDTAKRQLALGREAFAEHYLTDAFSGGHIRTPRPDIIAWYRANFGSPVIDEFISRLSNRLIDGLVSQISPQTNWPDFLIRRKVRKVVGEKLAAAIAAAGGRAKINDYFALAVAGVVSGAMHDLEGRRGVIVSSDAHPEPWVAFGDAQLSASPTSREQADLAIAAATDQIDQAYEIGRRHGRDADVANAPTVAYFGFDSATLTPEARSAAESAARYLHARPEARVTLTGHTDPTGPDSYNDGLGQRRADAVSNALTDGGVSIDQVTATSAGEHAPVTTVPGEFRLDRRVTLDYTTRYGPYRDVAAEEAAADLAAAAPAPYTEVTRFVPKPLPPTLATSVQGTSLITAAQVELENWRWGKIPPTLRSEINSWVQGYGKLLSARVDTEPALAATTVEGYSIDPRTLVKAIVTDLLADPATFLEQATGLQMSP